LFQTGPISLISSGSYEDYTIATGGLPLVTGNKYALFFTTLLDYDGILDSSSAAGINYTLDLYSGGEFILNNDATSLGQLSTIAWQTDFLSTIPDNNPSFGDLAFQASFSSVPEASACWLLLVVGLVAGGWVAARRVAFSIRGATGQGQ